LVNGDSAKEVPEVDGDPLKREEAESSKEPTRSLGISLMMGEAKFILNTDEVEFER